MTPMDIGVIARADLSARGNPIIKTEIAELVPSVARNLAPSLLRLRLATSLAMTSEGFAMTFLCNHL